MANIAQTEFIGCGYEWASFLVVINVVIIYSKSSNDCNNAFDKKINLQWVD